MSKLKISKLNVSIAGTKILSNISASFSTGDVVVIFGPNGAGKSTFLKSLLKHHSTEIISGSIVYNKKNLSKSTTWDIANIGFFYASQNPIELPGVQMVEFLKIIANSRSSEKISLYDLYKKVNENMKILQLDQDLLKRSVNVGFSGGQKKKNEILQSKLFLPEVLLLDEIDSGLDIDATKTIAKYITSESKNRITLIISHQLGFIKMLQPNKIMILANGKIEKIGTAKDLVKIQKSGLQKYMKKQSKDFVLEDAFKNHGK